MQNHKNRYFKEVAFYILQRQKIIMANEGITSLLDRLDHIDLRQPEINQLADQLKDDLYFELTRSEMLMRQAEAIIKFYQKATHVDEGFEINFQSFTSQAHAYSKVLAGLTARFYQLPKNRQKSPERSLCQSLRYYTSRLFKLLRANKKR